MGAACRCLPRVVFVGTVTAWVAGVLGRIARVEMPLGRIERSMKKCSESSRHRAAHAATAVLTIAFCVYAPHALACSCDYLPYGFIGPYTSRLPANAAGIPWYVSTRRARRPWIEDRLAVDEYRFTLEVLNDGQFLQIPLRVDAAQEFATRFDTYLIYHIGPMDEALRPGATYRVTDRLDPQRYGEPYEDVQVVVEIDHEALSAETLLTLHAAPARVDSFHVAAADGMCSGHLKVSQARIAARLPGELRKWEDQLLFSTIVDGKQWVARRSLCSQVEPGRGWDDVAHDRVFAACEEPSFQPVTPVLEPGSHTVMVEARLPGTDIVLRTATESVDLECPDVHTP